MPLAVSTLLMALAAPPAPPEPPARAGPWSRGTWTAGLGVNVTIPAGMTTVGLAGRGGYFVVNGLELGLQTEVTALLWTTSVTAELREFADALPRLAFRVTPTVRYVPLRREALGLYFLGGLGPTIYNKDGAVTGHWLVQPGLLLRLGGRVHLDLAFQFTQPFPGKTCVAAFTGGLPLPGETVQGYCEFRFGPHLGVMFAF